VLFDGSIRGGKTQAAVRWIVAKALQTGGTYVISRFSYRELEDSTKKVCLYGEGGMPPAIPEQVLWKRQPRQGEERDAQQGQARERRRDPVPCARAEGARQDPQHHRLRWFIDQAEELDGDDIEDFYQEIKGRCSDPRGP
jgi:hypothetical protein